MIKDAFYYKFIGIHIPKRLCLYLLKINCPIWIDYRLKEIERLYTFYMKCKKEESKDENWIFSLL